MKNKINWEKASELYENNPVCKKGITPYILIVNGIITYEDWLGALKAHPNNDMDFHLDDSHGTYKTNFGKKLIKLAKGMGFHGYEMSRKYHKRTADVKLESIKLINMSIDLLHIE